MKKILYLENLAKEMEQRSGLALSLRGHPIEKKEEVAWSVAQAHHRGCGRPVNQFGFE